MWWFLLALVLLVTALILLRLDSRRRSGAVPREPASDAGAGSGADDGDRGSVSGSDDDEAGQFARAGGSEVARSGESDSSPVAGDETAPASPQPAPFQLGTAEERELMRRESGVDAQSGVEEAAPAEMHAGDGAGNGAETGGAREDGGARETGGDAEEDATRVEADTTDAADTDESSALPTVAAGAGTAAVAAGAGAAGVAAGAGDGGSPKLADRIRRFLPARRPNRGPEAEPQPVDVEDPLADSPVVRWLEEREFAPTPTPAPDFRHGDFAGGLPALGTVSHGIFRGRRALMGVAGGRAVLALQRGTASDVVLDLSRADVDAEPGLHDAGEVAALEARTSDYGRLDLIDRDRLADAVRDLPADVRRVWAEGEWLVATVDDAGNPATWDDTVVALYDAADTLAPLPPVGGRARPLPGDIDPGAPGAASGPDADPAGGVPDPAGRQAPQAASGSEATAVASTAAAGSAVAGTAVAGTAAAMAAGNSSAAGNGGADAHGAAADGAEATPAAGAKTEATPEATPATGDGAAAPAQSTRRAGHLRLVPERRDGVRDLTEKPVVADRGDSDDDGLTDAPASTTGAPDPFAEIMESSGPVPSRGDVAADHLEPRPPLSRPTRGAGHAYPEDASVPPLAAGVNTGASGIKPLGSEDDEDEIRSEVERFDAARIDGRSDFDTDDSGGHASGRHAARAEGEVPEWLRTDLPREGGRRRRRAEPEAEAEAGKSNASDPETGTDDQSDSGSENSGSERPGVEPDVERTMRIQLPPDIRD